MRNGCYWISTIWRRPSEPSFLRHVWHIVAALNFARDIIVRGVVILRWKYEKIALIASFRELFSVRHIFLLMLVNFPFGFKEEKILQFEDTYQLRILKFCNYSQSGTNGIFVIAPEKTVWLGQQNIWLISSQENFVVQTEFWLGGKKFCSTNQTSFVETTKFFFCWIATNRFVILTKLINFFTKKSANLFKILKHSIKTSNKRRPVSD